MIGDFPNGKFEIWNNFCPRFYEIGTVLQFLLLVFHVQNRCPNFEFHRIPVALLTKPRNFIDFLHAHIECLFYQILKLKVDENFVVSRTEQTQGNNHIRVIYT